MEYQFAMLAIMSALAALVWLFGFDEIYALWVWLREQDSALAPMAWFFEQRHNVQFACFVLLLLVFAVLTGLCAHKASPNNRGAAITTTAPPLPVASDRLITDQTKKQQTHISPAHTTASKDIPLFDSAALATRIDTDQALHSDNINVLHHLVMAIIDDIHVTPRDIEMLYDWFKTHPAAQTDKRTFVMWSVLLSAFSNGVFTEDKREEILSHLTDFCNAYEDMLDHMHFISVADLHSSARYRMVYEKAQGVITVRDIVFRTLRQEGGKQYIKAHCLDKEGLRTFRVDNVRSLTTINTHEALVLPSGR